MNRVRSDISFFFRSMTFFRVHNFQWVRFQEGWGYWGSVKWIKRKARSILKGEDWKKEVLRKWEEAGSPTV